MFVIFLANMNTSQHNMIFCNKETAGKNAHILLRSTLKTKKKLSS